MLYFKIIFWITIVIFSISYLISVLVPLANYKKDSKSVYLFLVSYIISTVIFFVSKELFLINVAIITWKILSVAPFIFSFCIYLGYRKRDINMLISFLLCSFFTLIPFVINIDISSKTDIISYFNNTYTLRTVLLIVFALLIIYSIVFILYNKRKNDRIINHLDRLYDIIQYRDKQNDERFESFKTPFKNYLFDEIKRLLAELNSTINKDIIVKKKIFNDNENSDLLLSISQEISDLRKEVRLLTRKKRDDKIDNLTDDLFITDVDIERYDNYDIISELNHFLATPFSQIIINCELLKGQTKKSSIDIYIKRIKNSIELCQCVIKAYRDITEVSESIKNNTSLKKLLYDAFNLYLAEYNKEDLTLELVAFEDVMGYSNNLIISLLCPLLQNAIVASPPNSTIIIEYTNDNIANKQIQIRNRSLFLPRIEDLNTPGFSSKEGHQGTGLLMVRHLLQLRNNGELICEIVDDIIIFTIKLNR